MPSERHQLKTEFAHVHQLLCSLCKVRLLIVTMMMIITMTTIMIMMIIIMMTIIMMMIIMMTTIMIMFRIVRMVLQYIFPDSSTMPTSKTKEWTKMAQAKLWNSQK